MLMRFLGRVLLAMLISLAIGTIVGTALRMRLEGQQEYIGAIADCEARIA